MKRFFKHVLFVALLAPLAAQGFVFERNQFYGTHPFSEPRYTRNGLTSISAQLSGGRTKTAFNGDKDKVDLLRIYGDHNFVALGYGSIGNPQSNNYNALLADLYGSGVDLSGTGSYSYAGKFSHIQGNIFFAQNIYGGFFVEANVPFKRLEVSEIVGTDLSTGIDAANVAWIAVKNNITGILNQYNLSTATFKKTGVGDVTISGGWTYSYTESSVLDFLDTTIKLGISIPSADKKDLDNAWAIALGSDQHIGMPVSFAMAAGAFDWLTFGAHVDGTFFANKTKMIRINTNPAQTGFFKLLKAEAKYEMGAQVDVGGYLKADHVFHGFSLLGGYTFTYKGHDVVTPTSAAFSTLAANADPVLKSIHSHAIIAGMEYDFAGEDKKQFNPHISLFYTQPVAGKRIFKTATFGGTLGVHIAWDF